MDLATSRQRENTCLSFALLRENPVSSRIPPGRPDILSNTFPATQEDLKASLSQGSSPGRRREELLVVGTSPLGLKPPGKVLLNGGRLLWG